MIQKEEKVGFKRKSESQSVGAKPNVMMDAQQGNHGEGRRETKHNFTTGDSSKASQEPEVCTQGHGEQFCLLGAFPRCFWSLLLPPVSPQGL